MRFVIYWSIVMVSAMEAMLEKFLNGWTPMFWLLTAGSVFFWLAAFGARLNDKEASDKKK